MSSLVPLVGFRSTSLLAVKPLSLLVIALGAGLLGGCGAEDFDVRLRGPAGITTGASAELTSFIEGGAAPFACTWSGEGIAQSDCEGALVTPTAATTYTLTVTDDRGVSASARLEIGVFEPLSLSFEPSHDLYRGQTVVLGPEITGGVPDLTCTWALDGQTVSEQCDPLSVSPDRDSGYSLVVRDGAGNFAVATAFVRVREPLEVSVEPALSQHYAGEDFMAFGSISGGFPPITCAWTQGEIELSDRCDRVPLVATDDALLTFEATDARGTTASAIADVRVLTLIPPDVSEVISRDWLSLTAAATGLIGAPVCAWTQDGAPIPADGACTVTIQPAGQFWTSQTQISLTLTDADTGHALSADLPITVLSPTCDDGVYNGTETDVDCGGPSLRAWVNEAARIHYDIAAPGVTGARDLLLVEVVVPEDEVVIDLPAGIMDLSVVPHPYELVAGVYVPRSAQPLLTADPIQACLPSSMQDEGGLVFAACLVSFSAEGTALAIVRNDGVLVDFIVYTGDTLAVAEGGPADGFTPRRLPFAPPVTTRTEFGTSLAPSLTTCLVGEGTLGDFTWEDDCTPTLEPGAFSNSSVNPGQVITALPELCPLCLEGERCEATSDCDEGLTCDDEAQVCGVDEEP